MLSSGFQTSTRRQQCKHAPSYLHGEMTTYGGAENCHSKKDRGWRSSGLQTPAPSNGNPRLPDQPNWYSSLPCSHQICLLQKLKVSEEGMAVALRLENNFTKLQHFSPILFLWRFRSQNTASQPFSGHCIAFQRQKDSPRREPSRPL